jgi:hypothetical protein
MGMHATLVAETELRALRHWIMEVVAYGFVGEGNVIIDNAKKTTCEFR